MEASFHFIFGHDIPPFGEQFGESPALDFSVHAVVGDVVGFD